MVHYIESLYLMGYPSIGFSVHTIVRFSDVKIKLQVHFRIDVTFQNWRHFFRNLSGFSIFFGIRQGSRWNTVLFTVNEMENFKMSTLTFLIFILITSPIALLGAIEEQLIQIVENQVNVFVLIQTWVSFLLFEVLHSMATSVRREDINQVWTCFDFTHYHVHAYNWFTFEKFHFNYKFIHIIDLLKKIFILQSIQLVYLDPYLWMGRELNGRIKTCERGGRNTI